MSEQEEISSIKDQIATLEKRLAILGARQREQKSRAFIEANEITIDDVQLSSGEGVPYFGVVYELAKWMKRNGCAKRFAEWNGQIHFRSDLEDSRFNPTAGLVEHLTRKESNQ